MNADFQPALKAAIDGLLAGVSRKDLAARADKLSRAYRAGQASGSTVIAGRDDALAYLLARAPATFAAMRAALFRAEAACPSFAPQSLLDVGAGPGTAAHAALAAFPSLGDVTLLEPNSAFRALAAALLPRARLIAARLDSSKPKADLVTAAYVLAELPQSEAGRVARDLWISAEKMLVLVEPGTPAGFARIRAAREALTACGAHTAAPCTHDNVCPMAAQRAGDSRSDHKKSYWCHFSQRLSRSRDHMILKDASVPFEDERYSYLVAVREPVKGRRPGSARIIKPPPESKPGIAFPLCGADGLRSEFVARRDKDRFRAMRKLEWGDLFQEP